MADVKKKKGDMAKKMVRLHVKDNNTKKLHVKDMSKKDPGASNLPGQTQY